MHLHLAYLCIKLPFFWIQSSFAICLLWRSPVWSWLSLSIVRLTTSRKTDGYRMMTRHWFGHRVLAAEFVDETCKLLLPSIMETSFCLRISFTKVVRWRWVSRDRPMSYFAACRPLCRGLISRWHSLRWKEVWMSSIRWGSLAENSN